MRHVLSALVQNVPGVLAHVAGMLASRGYNIDSLAVGETEDPVLSRMTFVVVGDWSRSESSSKRSSPWSAWTTSAPRTTSSAT
jgi:acetolactate synthase small subunit